MLADKGYHTGEQLGSCEEDPVLDTYVAPVTSKRGTAGFRKADFRYDAEQRDRGEPPDGVPGCGQRQNGIAWNWRYGRKGLFARAAVRGYQINPTSKKAIEKSDLFWN